MRKSVYFPSHLNPFNKKEEEVKTLEKGGQQKVVEKAIEKKRKKDKRKFRVGDRLLVELQSGEVYPAECFGTTKQGLVSVRPLCGEQDFYGHRKRGVHPERIILKR